MSDSKEGIYISRNGKVFGPYPNDLLIQYIQDGLVLGTDYIYLPKQKKWEKIAVVYEQFLIEKEESDIQESESDCFSRRPTFFLSSGSFRKMAAVLR